MENHEIVAQDFLLAMAATLYSIFRTYVYKTEELNICYKCIRILG